VTHRHQRLVAVPALLALAAALVPVPVALARADVSTRCNPNSRETQSVAAPKSPISQQASLVRAAVASGWIATAAGRGVLAGRLPAAQVGADGTLMGSATLAIAPAGLKVDLNALRTSTQRSTQSTKAPKRTAGTTVVFMNCGVAQRANVNYYVVAGATTWVTWELINFSNGNHTFSTSGANYCPAGTGGCLEYFWIVPTSPRYVFAAQEVANIGFPSPLNSYCGG
jgi:hypothetical protein